MCQLKTTNIQKEQVNTVQGKQSIFFNSKEEIVVIKNDALNIAIVSFSTEL